MTLHLIFNSNLNSDVVKSISDLIKLNNTSENFLLFLGEGVYNLVSKNFLSEKNFSFHDNEKKVKVFVLKQDLLIRGIFDKYKNQKNLISGEFLQLKLIDYADFVDLTEISSKIISW